MNDVDKLLKDIDIKIISNLTFNESREKIQGYHNYLIIEPGNEYYNSAVIIELHLECVANGLLLFKNDNGLTPIIHSIGNTVIIGYNDKLLIIVNDCSRQLFFEKLNSIIMDIKLYEDYFVVLMETDLLIMDYYNKKSRTIYLHDMVTDYNFSKNSIFITTDDGQKHHIVFEIQDTD